MQLFTKQNCTNATFSADQVDVPSPKPNFPEIAVTGITITNADNVVAIKLAAPTNPSLNTVLRAAKPQSAGRWALPSCQIIGTCLAPVAHVSDITALYVARFGAPLEGDKIFVTVNQIVAGHESPQVAFSAVVPASS